MNRDSRLSGRLVLALLAGAFTWLISPSGAALAQDDAAPATNTASAAPAEGAPQSRRDRRRAAKAETAASAVETQTGVAAASTVSGGDAEAVVESEIVCKSIKPLGTRMAKRVCGTPAQWAALAKKTTDAAEDDMRQVGGQGAVLAPGAAAGP